MTLQLRPESIPVWHSDRATIGDVLDALNGIRHKFAREEVGDEELPRPRNYVMTLVAMATNDAEERRATRVCRIIGAQHPAQAIVVRDQEGMAAGQIEGWISADVRRPQTGCAVQCELVTLHVRGAAGAHLAELIDPLLMSGVPTNMWWVGTPPFGRHELEDALKVCDALVVDSARFDAPYHSFLGLSRLTTSVHSHLGVGDLQWARLNAWRDSIAQFFSPGERRPFLRGISEVGIEYAGEGRGNRVAAALITGWLASALGWKLHRARAGLGGVVLAHYMTQDSRLVEVQFRSMPKPHLIAGELGAVRIGGAGQGETFQLSVQRDPERTRAAGDDAAFLGLHRPGGDDEAGLELAERSAEWHRDVLHENRDMLHHTASGDPPGEALPRHPMVFTRERRRPDSSQVLLTMIRIGEGDTLRHVQRVEPEDEAPLLLELLAGGTRDEVFTRSLAAAVELMHAF